MNQPSRRFFLRGLGGASLAIPTMPSLLGTREAKAALAADDKIFIGFMSHYGGVWAKKMLPILPSSGSTVAMDYAGKKVRKGPLAATVSGGITKVSDVLQAPSNVFTQSIVDKMTVLQGIDLPFDTNHHSSATFGNYAQGDGKVKIAGGAGRATIDQVIANSPAFYKNLAGITQRSVFVSQFGELSYKQKVPGNINSGVDKPPTYMDPVALWSALFGSAKPNVPAAARPSIVDLVKEDYTRLKNAPQLAAADKVRLEEHVNRIAEIERRLAVTISCNTPSRPSNPANPVCGQPSTDVAFYESFLDILVAGLSCGLTRVATVLHQGWSTTFGERCNDPWHQEVSHKVDAAGPQESMASSMRTQFSRVIAPLVAKLDASKDANGKSLLDRSLVYWTQEHGVFSHAQENIPVVTFGSANGAFNTGLHLDYRDLNRMIPKGQFGDTPGDQPYVGLTWHQMLGTIARGFGIPQTEWKEPNHGGFGLKPSNLSASSYNNRYNFWGTPEWNAAADNLPFWVKAS
ncbi:MAG: DUF1552 domain-containing protein [Deltaproteobacteria bacterium]|nr:DUF1552 domain-containing protein [Deltaproteobacteria bacterium]